ncbi:MAG: SPOR domain-containing protein [Firmicutes bacterium]|jgi:cell division septation protein DedD|nr:SPOR domain-containing protein [Bacillota bacterium]
MSERAGRTKERSLWFVLVWIVTLGAMVGLGILLGKYVLSYYASSLQSSRTNEVSIAELSPSEHDNSQSVAIPVSPISPEPQEKQKGVLSKDPTVSAPGEAGITRGSTGISEEPILYKVQVGEFHNREEAEDLGRKLEEAGYPVFITPVAPHRIQIGAFQNKANADALVKEIETQGYPVIVQQ